MPRGRPCIHRSCDSDVPRRPRGRPRKTPRTGARFGTAESPAPHITINGHRVTWSFIIFVHKRLHDWDDTIDAFWKARNATGPNGIYRYVMAGFSPGKNRVPWNTVPSREREEGKMEKIRDWWIGLYTPAGNRRTATLSVDAPDVATMMRCLVDGMGME
jgi:hypothetical protein